MIESTPQSTQKLETDLTHVNSDPAAILALSETKQTNLMQTENSTSKENLKIIKTDIERSEDKDQNTGKPETLESSEIKENPNTKIHNQKRKKDNEAEADSLLKMGFKLASEFNEDSEWRSKGTFTSRSGRSKGTFTSRSGRSKGTFTSKSGRSGRSGRSEVSNQTQKNARQEPPATGNWNEEQMIME